MAAQDKAQDMAEEIGVPEIARTRDVSEVA